MKLSRLVYIPLFFYATAARAAEDDPCYGPSPDQRHPSQALADPSNEEDPSVGSHDKVAPLSPWLAALAQERFKNGRLLADHSASTFLPPSGPPQKRWYYPYGRTYYTIKDLPRSYYKPKPKFSQEEEVAYWQALQQWCKMKEERAKKKVANADGGDAAKGSNNASLGLARGGKRFLPNAGMGAAEAGRANAAAVSSCLTGLLQNTEEGLAIENAKLYQQFATWFTRNKALGAANETLNKKLADKTAEVRFLSILLAIGTLVIWGVVFIKLKRKLQKPSEGGKEERGQPDGQ